MSLDESDQQLKTMSLVNSQAYHQEPDPKLLFKKGMPLKQPKEMSSVAVNLQAGGTGSVQVSRKVTLVRFVQDPYTSTDYQRFELISRKSSPVKIAFALRTHMMFGKGSELQIRLNNYDLETLSKDDQVKKIDAIKKANIDLLEEIEERDSDLLLNKKVKTLVKQAWIYGRGVIIKLYEGDNLFLESKIAKLQTINSRRLLFPIVDIDNNNHFEGCIVDVQGLAKESMIYATYDEDELSPHTEEYGYSQIESIAHIAEALNIITAEDVKEIAKSGWLDSVLLEIQTAGLTNSEAQTKINNIVKSVAKAGKIIGVNETVKATSVARNPNFDGIVKVIEKLELMIFNALQVPEFLVQSEAAANRATAITAATQFLNGVVADDQQWIEDILQNQWYDPYLIENKANLKGVEISTNPELTETERDDNDLPFHIRRVYNQAKASEFIDLASSVVALKNAGVWDLQKANEILDSEEVTQRIMSQENDAKEGNIPVQEDQTAENIQNPVQQDNTSEEAQQKADNNLPN